MTYSLLKLRGWAIHAITASGAIVSLFAFYAISQHQYHLALLLMLLTIVIDAIDGPLARFWKVKHVVPNFDGARLDYIVDFSSWVILPAFFLLSTEQLMPYPWNMIASCMIVISSSYQFCCTDLKATTSNFKRWPSAWSLMLILLLTWHYSALFNFMLISVCAVFSFIPTYYSHPFQKNSFGGKPQVENVINGILVGAGIAFLISVLISVLFYPHPLPINSLIQQAILLAYIGFCIYGTLQHWD